MFAGDSTNSDHVMYKRPFLLAEAMLIERTTGELHYSHSEQLSVQETTLGLRPVALDEAARTSSKTLSEPGDDDPDVDGEQCD